MNRKEAVDMILRMIEDAVADGRDLDRDRLESILEFILDRG